MMSERTTLAITYIKSFLRYSVDSDSVCSIKQKSLAFEQMQTVKRYRSLGIKPFYRFKFIMNRWPH